MTKARTYFVFLVVAAASLALSARPAVQSGTVTDGASLSGNPTTQLFKLDGHGMSFVVTGSGANVDPTHGSTTTTYIKR